jgi:Flp pilus assembly protein protease CpaA
MLLSILFAFKIAYTDLRYRKIENKDLSILLVLFVIHHRIHHYLLAGAILGIGFLFQKFVGAGDVKLLALVALSRDSQTGLSKAVSYIAIATFVTLVMGLLMKKRGERIPLGPAIAFGLFG